MGLCDAVATSIRELSTQFDGLQEQITALQLENTSLRCQLSALITQSIQCAPKKPEEKEKGFYTLPGETEIPIIQLPGMPAFGEPSDTVDTEYEASLSRRSSVKRVDPDVVNKLFREGGLIRGAIGTLEEPQETTALEGNLGSQKLSMLLMDPTYDEGAFKQRSMMTFHEFLAALSGRNHGGNCIERVASSLLFHGLAMAAILSNAAYLGVSAHLELRDSYKRVLGETPQGPYEVVDYCFATWFAVEILIRIAAHKWDFVYGEGWKWNLFDSFLVFESFASLFLPGMRNISCLRILRVFRMVRIVRLVRQVTALKKLRTMVFAFINSFFDLMWAILVIFVIIFIFSFFFASSVSSYFNGVNPDSPSQVADAMKVNEDFGGMISTMLSLWAAVSGGNDWMMYAEAVGTTGRINKYIFIFYIAFCATGMWNVVTGVFVDSAVCSRTEDEVVQGYLDEYRNTIAQMRGFFAEVCEDGKGDINFEQFLRCLRNPTVKAYLSGLGIDPEEGQIIFAILDANKNGAIDMQEFVNGLLKLKGSATKLDFMAMMYDSTMQNLKFDNLVEFVEKEVAVIKSLIATRA